MPHTSTSHHPIPSLPALSQRPDTMRIYPLQTFVTKATRFIPENRVLQRAARMHHWSFLFQYENIVNARADSKFDFS